MVKFKTKEIFSILVYILVTINNQPVKNLG